MDVCVILLDGPAVVEISNRLLPYTMMMIRRRQYFEDPGNRWILATCCRIKYSVNLFAREY